MNMKAVFASILAALSLLGLTASALPQAEEKSSMDKLSVLGRVEVSNSEGGAWTTK